jgi:hypothetical protein
MYINFYNNIIIPKLGDDEFIFQNLKFILENDSITSCIELTLRFYGHQKKTWKKNLTFLLFFYFTVKFTQPLKRWLLFQNK